MLTWRVFTQIAVVQLLHAGTNAAPASWGSSINSSTSNDQIASTEELQTSTAYPPTDWEAIWSNYISEKIADRCTGRGGYYSEQLRLTINLYSCLEKEPSGGLLDFFTSTGLNITYKRLEAMNALNGTNLQTSDTSTQESFAAADDTTTSANYVPQFLGNAGLDALLHRVADHAENLCFYHGHYWKTRGKQICEECRKGWSISETPFVKLRNTDALMDCLDPFLHACFADEPTPLAEDAYHPDTKRTWDDQWLSDVSSFVNMFDTNRTDSSNQTTEILSSTERSGNYDTTNDAEWTSSSTESEFDAQPSSTSSVDETTGRFTEAPSKTYIIDEIDVVVMIPDNSTDSSYSTTTDDDTSEDQADGSENVPQGWFSLPYLTNADRISQMLRRQLQIVCESNMDTRNTQKRPLQDALNALYCVFDDYHTPSSPCPVDNYDSPDSRIIDKAYVNCILDTVHDQCSANGADTLHAVIDEYVVEAAAVQQGIFKTTKEVSATIQETTDETPTSLERMRSTISNSTNSSDTSLWWLVA